MSKPLPFPKKIDQIKGEAWGSGEESFLTSFANPRGKPLHDEILARYHRTDVRSRQGDAAIALLRELQGILRGWNSVTVDRDSDFWQRVVMEIGVSVEVKS
jgi:hypothetical protein